MPEAQLGPALPQSPNRTDQPPAAGGGDPFVGLLRLADELDQPPIIELAPFPRLTPRRDATPTDRPAAATVTARRLEEQADEPPDPIIGPRPEVAPERRGMSTWETVPLVVVIVLLAVLGALVLERWGPRADPPELAGRAGPGGAGSAGETAGACSADLLAAALPDDSGLALSDDAPRCEQGYALARLEPDVAGSGQEVAAFRLAEAGTWEGFAVIRASDCDALGDVVDPDFPASLC
jgi:hypothetical protein